MLFRKVKRIAVCLIFALVCACSTAAAQTTFDLQTDADVAKFVAESYKNQLRANWQMMHEYTYKNRYSVTYRKGKTVSWLTEQFFPSRFKRGGGTRGVFVTLEKNGVPLAPEKIEKERREVAEELEEADSESEAKSGSSEEEREKGSAMQWKWVGVNASPYQYLYRCRFTAPKREIVDGRQAIALDFDDCKAGEGASFIRYMPNLRGRAWFDEADKMPIRFEIFAKNKTPANSVATKPAILIVQKKVREGFWFLNLIEVEGIGNEAVFPDTKVNWKMEFSDFALSQTEIKDYKIGATEKQ